MEGRIAGFYGNYPQAVQRQQEYPWPRGSPRQFTSVGQGRPEGAARRIPRNPAGPGIRISALVKGAGEKRGERGAARPGIAAVGFIEQRGVGEHHHAALAEPALGQHFAGDRAAGSR